MDFSTIIYILLIVGWFIFSIFKNMNKEEAARQAQKNRKTVTIDEDGELTQPKPKKKKKEPASPIFQETTGNNEYFSYETMSERDFEEAFNQKVESENEVLQTQPSTPNIRLSMDEEEVYKGVVWSEILKRKY
jgi:hypothetical protein